MKRPLLLLIASVLTLAGCQRAATPEATPTSPPSAVTPFSVSPASIAQCEPAVEATVKWDASATAAITTVEIWVSDGGEFKLFAAGGAKGEARTGAWTHPGTRFQARDPSTGNVLAALQVAGPKC